MRGIGRSLAPGVIIAMALLSFSTTAFAQHHGGGGHYGGFSHYGGGYGHYGGGYGHYGSYRHYGGYGHYWPSLFFGAHYGYGPYYWSPYYYPYYYGRYYYPPYAYDSYYDDLGAVRLQVEPARARVFVDGYYAGIVDDFDGPFQRLRLAPGRHELSVRLEGYRTHRVLLYAAPGRTIRFHCDMTQGSGEDEPDELAGAAPARGVAAGEPRRRERADGEDVVRYAYAAASRVDQGRRKLEGELRLSVRPEDASVYVDGEFRGTGGNVRRLALSPGRHQVEVVRPGFRVIEREVEIQSGQALDLDVEMQ